MILVFGKTGQVATELQRQENVVALGREEADLANPAACVAAIRAHSPTAVINAAAYTAVDKAEEEETLATTVNGTTPTEMAKVCAELDIPFVQISTDYVFDGSGENPFTVDATTGPLGAYGRSKLVGETGVRDANGTHAILRTSWVFSAHGNNFVKTMLRLGSERDLLTIVADQIGGPTAASDIASVCLEIADQLKSNSEKSGTYHLSGAPDVSWADFARRIFANANIACEVKDIPASDFPTPAKRPANSRMDCSKLDTFALKRPNWEESLNFVLQELEILS
jgi:dTDP-4-dehydrorhamnose reductase